MKRTTLIGLLLLVVTFSHAQMTSTTDAKKVKSLKTIVALKEYPKNADDSDRERVDSANAAFRFAMANYWDFNEIADYMLLSEAKKYIKANEGYCYLTIDVGVSRSTVHNNRRYVTSNERLIICLPNQRAQVYLPYYEGPMTNTTAVFAVMQMNKIFDLLYKEEFTNIMGSFGYVKRNGPKIIQKTLLIPQEYISPKLGQDDIKLAYPYDLDFCTLDKIENAILTRDPKYAVIFYVPIPVGGKTVHRLFISNAEDGDIYGVSDGSTVDFGAQIQKKYLINEKELKQLNKMVSR